MRNSPLSSKERELNGAVLCVVKTFEGLNADTTAGESGIALVEAAIACRTLF